MKITKSQILKAQIQKIIREEIAKVKESSFKFPSSDLPFSMGTDEGIPEEGSVASHIQDAIQMLEAEEDTTGTLFHVINRLQEALSVLANDPGYNRIDDMD